MSYSVSILRSAQSDITNAINWYNKQNSGLGVEFLNDVIIAIDFITQNPKSLRLRHKTKSVRWIYPKRFPYRIVYIVADQTISIVAVIHAARHDSEWNKRV